MSYLLTRIALYGDILPLKFKLDYKKFEKGLKLFDDKWVQYNPRKNIPRKGLSITSLDGGFSGIPDLDSLKEYNDEHNVYIDEPDIKTKTPFYPYVESVYSFNEPKRMNWSWLWLKYGKNKEKSNIIEGEAKEVTENEEK